MKKTLPFGHESRFFDRSCPYCGNEEYGAQFMAEKRKTGGVFSKREWVTNKGEVVTPDMIKTARMPYS